MQQCHGPNANWRRKDGGKHDYMTILAGTVFEGMYACILAYMLSDSSHGSFIPAHECVMSVAGHGSSLYMYTCVHVYQDGMSDAGHDRFIDLGACELSDVGMHV